MHPKIKENLMLVTSISLPLVLVALFLIARLIPTVLVPAPAHDLLLSNSYYNGNFLNSRWFFSGFRVVDGVLHAEISAIDNPTFRSNINQPELYRYNHLADQLDRVEIDLIALLPAAAIAGTTSIPVPELAGVQLSSSLSAPDGYRYERYRGGGGGLMVDLFGAASYRNNGVLTKDGRIISFDTDNRYLEHIAWIVE